MADYKDRVEAYVVASELANLRGYKDKAIEIMRLVPEKCTGTGTIDARMPLPIFAHFHIAAYAKQAGDLMTAKQEYEKAIEELSIDVKQREEYAITAAICHLYIAEIDVAKTGKTDALSQRIKLIKELTPPVIPDEERQLFPDSDTPFEMIVKWADYQLVKKTHQRDVLLPMSRQPGCQGFRASYTEVPMSRLRRLGGAMVLAGMIVGWPVTATPEAKKPGGGGGNAAVCAYLKKIIDYPNTSPIIRAYALSLWTAYGCK